MNWYIIKIQTLSQQHGKSNKWEWLHPLIKQLKNFSFIWNRTRSRALMQNQHTRGLISAWNMQQKYNNKDLSRLR